MSTQIEEKDFKMIYTNTYDRILKFVISKCNNIEDINDIIQDTYLELLKKIKRTQKIQIENINQYLVGIANNIIKRHYHKKKKMLVLFSSDKEDDIEIKDEFDLEQDVITRENAKEVWEYVKKRDVETAKIFYLYFSLGLKISEIAEQLDLKESNVKNKLYRTLKQLKKLGKDVENHDK